MSDKPTIQDEQLRYLKKIFQAVNFFVVITVLYIVFQIADFVFIAIQGAGV